MSEWVKINSDRDNLPNKPGYYWIKWNWCDGIGIAEAKTDNYDKKVIAFSHLGSWVTGEVTHWREIDKIEPPKDEE